MDSPWPTIILCLLYALTVCVAGPLYMRDRPPYNLKWALVIYNAAQVILSLALVYGGVSAGWDGTYDFWCQPVDISDDPKASLMVKVVWLYFFSKFIEFLDTFFFVLRKKYNQV
jgi:elongation of very long chain fatty acids protein 7